MVKTASEWTLTMSALTGLDCPITHAKGEVRIGADEHSTYRGAECSELKISNVSHVHFYGHSLWLA